MVNAKKLTIGMIWILALLFVAEGSATAAGKRYYKRSIEKYQIPDVMLLDQNGKKVHLRTFIDPEKPVMLDFIYGTCTTICPVLSVGFAHFQKKLGTTAEQVQLVSISIDPDNDTPEVMKAHLQKYGAGPGWYYLTGKRGDIIAVLKEFDAYVINKMNHYPLTILRAPGQQEWVRLYGLLSASDLMKEYKQLTE